jgi:hypothetical protein
VPRRAPAESASPVLGPTGDKAVVPAAELVACCLHAITAASRVAVRAAAFDPLREPGRRRRAYGFDPIVSNEPASTRLLLWAMSGAPKH